MSAKRLNCEEFSAAYAVRELRRGDGEAVLTLYRTNPLYYACCGTEATLEGVYRAMELLPPGVSEDSKYYCGYSSEGRLLAVLDLIGGYPDEETSYIGFFMVDGREYGQGRGSAILAELVDCMKRRGLSRLRLAYDEKNPQARHFWNKQGFVPIKRAEHEYGLLTVGEKTIV